MVSAPEKVFGASHAVEEVIKEEIETEQNAAETKEISDEIKNGTISPKERKHYEQGILHIQRSGIKRKEIQPLLC